MSFKLHSFTHDQDIVQIPSKATTRKSKTPQDHALQYFDTYYKPLYGDRWPSVRLALLSQQKYCAVVNNFGDVSDTCVNLMSAGADDVVQVARSLTLKRTRRQQDQRDKATLDAVNDTPGDSRPDLHGDDASDVAPRISPVFTVRGEDGGEETDADNVDRSSLYDFMPVRRVVTEAEQLEQDEVTQGSYRPAAVDINVYPDDGAFRLPPQLKAFVYPRGNVSRFPTPAKGDSNKLNYYVMNAASILPVLALDVQPDSKVIDLCAAPGGKTLAILQILEQGSLTCVDHSYKRLQRLREVLQWYTPHSFLNDKKVDIVYRNAIKLGLERESREAYDRVLVDVPCYTDRHVLLNEENNIFRPIRMAERLQLQEIQRELLFAAVHCCRRGGVVVYATCTLAPAQNDGVVAATLEQLWRDTRVDVQVVDTRHLVTSFKRSFDFADSAARDGKRRSQTASCRFGQLVVPNLVTNCGPMYICKLRRL